MTSGDRRIVAKAAGSDLLTTFAATAPSAAAAAATDAVAERFYSTSIFLHSRSGEFAAAFAAEGNIAVAAA